MTSDSEPTFVIATDEAGYGPKLGPLVVVATTWKLPDPVIDSNDDLQQRFAQIAEPFTLGGQRVAVDDSKQVFRRGDGLAALHAVTSAALHWIEPGTHTFPACLGRVCRQDRSRISAVPWLNSENETPMLAQSDVAPLVRHWSSGGATLVDFSVRTISAGSFNDAIDAGGNKADLLSRTTLELVGEQVQACETESGKILVFCDRHGGRRYYAAPLQHQFPDHVLSVQSESKAESRYRLGSDKGEVSVRFTVKGDRFAPVAFSSLIAKYLRERFMESFNSYFAKRHVGSRSLKPTAGYPVDADRFLADIEAIRQREEIDDALLIRCR